MLRIFIIFFSILFFESSSFSQDEYFRSRAQVEQNLRDQFGGGIDFNDQILVEAIQDLTNNSLIFKK